MRGKKKDRINAERIRRESAEDKRVTHERGKAESAGGARTCTRGQSCLDNRGGSEDLRGEQISLLLGEVLCSWPLGWKKQNSSGRLPNVCKAELCTAARCEAQFS